MIAADSSTWIAFLEGEGGRDADELRSALREHRVVMPPAVLTELFSDPRLAPDIAEILLAIPLIDAGPEYWRQAGILRSRAVAKRRKARLGDALIAQSCIEGGVPLITRDRDFRAFAEGEGLKIVVGFDSH